MSLRVRGYDADGHKLYDDLGPAENPQWVAHIGGRSIVDAAPFMAPVIRPQAMKVQKRRDYHESVLKGHETRRLRGALLAPGTQE